jgi:P-type Ca2+ transporter type 2C
VLPAYLLTVRGSDIDTTRTAAVLAWLAGHALIAWTLRTQPGLSWAANPAFSAWAATAIGTALLLALTPLGRLVHLAPWPPDALGPLAGLLLAAVAVAMLLRHLLGLNQRL